MPNMEIVFHYTDIFHDTVPDITEVVQSLNMHKAISIICELIQTKNYKINSDIPFVGQCVFPYESGMKCLLWPTEKPEDLKTRAWYFDKKTHIYCEQYLLILLKYVLAYGNLDTLKANGYSIDADDYKTILRLCLAIGEKQHVKFSGETDQSIKNHFIYGNYHVNRNSSVAAAFVRTYYLFNRISNNSNVLDVDAQKEYKDYNKAFETKYGYTIVQLINSLMWEMHGYFDPDLRIAYSSIWKNIERQYSNTPCKEVEDKVISSLSQPVEQYREWAKNTIDEDWDFSEFLTHPFLADQEGNYISISEYTIRNALFYNVYWMIRACYPEEDKRAMAFYGRLYEKYLQDITADAVKNNSDVAYLPEFKKRNGKDEIRSSDAYFQKNDCLIAIEMKGFMILIDSLIKNEKVEENYKKLFVKPVCQAYECFENLQKAGEFLDIKKLYIIAVTMDSVTSVPDYINNAKSDIQRAAVGNELVDCFNLNVDEYELFLSAIEHGLDPFIMLEDYINQCKQDPYMMFQNYIRDKQPEIEMTDMMQSIYEEFSKQLKDQFGVS